MTVVVIVIVAVVAVLALFVVLGYNGLVRLRNEVETGWSNIDVQLRRRFDLIPNLVETVKGYAVHERETFEEVTRARARLGSAEGPRQAAEANVAVGEAVGKLLLVSEAYPQLRASENFLALQEELTDTEDKIAAARRYYNATVYRFNTRQETLPWLPVARAFRFRRAEFFEAGEEAEGPVAVSFGR